MFLLYSSCHDADLRKTILGEEADIVLLSLVRNPGQNKAGAIGFLKVRGEPTVSFVHLSCRSHPIGLMSL